MSVEAAPISDDLEAVEPIELVDELLACSNDPLRFVELAFPDIKPEDWQRRVLMTIGEQLSENARLGTFKPVQIAVASGNNVGKSALLSWLILFSLITFEDTIGVCTAGSEAQLRTRLWGELAKWHSQLPEDLRAAFELTATAIFNRQHERQWRIDARAWSSQNQESFSGVHNYKKRVLMCMDECSMITENIFRACDGMLTDSQTQIIFCIFGNPLRLDGRFPQVFPGGRFHGLWKCFNVDARTVSLTNKESLNEKINYYGPDSNYVKSHILGQFPSASTEQLIPRDLVEEAAVREALSHPADALILGCDVASGHGEDSSVIYIRRGLDGRSYPPRKFPNLDPLQFAYKIAATARELNADAIFIDAGGVGEGTSAKCRELGLAVQSIYFGSRADNSGGLVRCANKRSEMWCAMAQWLKAGAIPDDDELKAQLVGPEYSENAQGLILERKEDLRARGLASPDIADALALSFAVPVVGRLAFEGTYQVQSEYNPFSDANMRGEQQEQARPPRFYANGWSKLLPEYE